MNWVIWVISIIVFWMVIILKVWMILLMVMLLLKWMVNYWSLSVWFLVCFSLRKVLVKIVWCWIVLFCCKMVLICYGLKWRSFMLVRLLLWLIVFVKWFLMWNWFIIIVCYLIGFWIFVSKCLMCGVKWVRMYLYIIVWI